MTKQRVSRVFLCLLAVALSGSAMMAPSSAQDARSAAPEAAPQRGGPPPRSGADGMGGDSKPDHASAAPDSSGNAATQTVDSASGSAHPAVNAHYPDNRDPETIDTRITVSPHGFGGARNNAGHAQIVKPVTPRDVLARRRFAPGASNSGLRNAVGLPLIGNGRPEQRAGAPGNFAAASRGRSLNLNVLEGTSGHFARTEERIEPALRKANPIVRSMAPNHGGISGTGLKRRGSGPAGIGGPAIAAVGINGSAIRPKHSTRP